MKAVHILLLLLLISSFAGAEDLFHARVQRAKSVEGSPEGKEYQQVLWMRIGNYTATTMQQCFPKEVKADPTFFTLVADVLPGGSLARVEVKPSTEMTECFAERFRSAPFPSPPVNFKEKGLPIVVEMKVTP